VPEVTWTPPDGAQAPGPVGWAGRARLMWRVPSLLVVLLGGLGVHLTVRMLERPVFGLRRPLTPFITQGVCRAALLILGLRLQVRGEPMRARGAMVANHAGWIDIFVLNAVQRLYFVSKSEVATWPGIGWLARATGTVFINRRARDARLQKEIFEARLRAGHHLCFFPEGTSTDGLRVLPFKSTLFEAFFTHGLSEITSVQPVSSIYLAPPGQPAGFFGWFGEMSFLSHFLLVCAAPRAGRAVVVFHEPVEVAQCRDRKVLARCCEDAVRTALEAELGPQAQG
jgi:lyso-ornithine lipid O-acyltransferase